MGPHLGDLDDLKCEATITEITHAVSNRSIVLRPKRLPLMLILIISAIK